MDIRVLENYDALSAAAAAHIESLLGGKDRALICLAAGDSPKGVYASIARALLEGRLESTRLSVVQLDEWEGLSAEDDGSCAGFIRDAFVRPSGLGEERVRYFDAKHAEAGCLAIEAFLAAEGPIWLSVLGIGPNGHLGLNEPGSAFDSPCRVVHIADSTARTGQKYFAAGRKLERGVTIGLAALRASRHVVLIASGPTKAQAVGRLFSGKPDTDSPLSSMLDHPSCVLYLDREAAVLLPAGKWS